MFKSIFAEIGGLYHLLPKFKNIFVAVITFPPFLLCRQLNGAIAIVNCTHVQHIIHCNNQHITYNLAIADYTHVVSVTVTSWIW